MDEKSVWTARISARQARAVARALRAAGYGTATIDNCREHVMNVARYFEPGDAVARQNVIDIICQAAGIQPKGH